MSVSSRTLFHFTKEYNTLVSILRNGGFWPRYCRETGWGQNGNVEWAVPMTCFTDIPLRSILEHMDWYGDYGIGMSKEWAIKNGRISPILYLNKMSTGVISTISRRSHANGWCDSDYVLYSLIKRYEGTTANKLLGQNRKKILYNEREWRYIPVVPELLRIIPLKEGVEFNCNQASERTREYMAKFTISDIHYLIISNESEKVQLMGEIDSIFSKYSLNERQALKTKIISREYLEQIV